MNRLLLLFIAALLATSSSVSQGPLWQPTQGPTGGAIFSFCFGGSWTYAGGEGGVFASSDNGDHWTHIGPSNTKVTKIVAGMGYVFVACEPQGLLRTGDRGKTWQFLGDRLPEFFLISDMVIKDGIVYAAECYAWYGIYRSTNCGDTWTPANQGIDNRSILKLFATKTSLIATAAGTQGSGMFRSTDNGVSWRRNDPNPYAWWATGITSVGDVLWASVYENYARVFRSGDDGQTWGYPLAGPDDMIFHLYGNAAGIFAGTYEHGLYYAPPLSGWINVGKSLLHQSYTALGGTEAFVYVASYDGISRTESGPIPVPVAFEQKNQGLVNSTVTCMTASGPAMLAGTSGGGLFQSKDKGTTWDRIGLRERPFVIDVLSERSKAFAVAATTYGETKGLVTASTDGGSHWMSSSLTVAVSSLLSADGILYATGGASGLFASSDLGVTWGSLGCPGAASVAAMDSILIVACSNGTLFRSSDRGGSWARVSLDSEGSHPVNVVAVLAGLMFAGCDLYSEVYQSSDAGVTWKKLTGVPRLACGVKALTGAGGAVYAVLSENEGVLGSVDGGRTWRRLTFGLSGLNVGCLFVTDDYLFAGTSGAGVYRMPVAEGITLPPVEFYPANEAREVSVDPTFYWQPYDGFHRYIMTLSTDSLFRDIIASDSNVFSNSTNVTGLRHSRRYFWRVDGSSGGVTWPLVNSRFTTAGGSFHVSQNYPNPFNAQTTIEFTVPVASRVDIEVSNVLGQRVCTLLSEELAAGDHTALWNAGGVPSGVYLCRVRSGENSAVRKLLLIR